MERRFLITTALEETWPNKEESVLFLGEWCCLHANKEKWESLDYQILKYRWDDRQKLHDDYVYLLDVYEIILKELTASLNKLHGVEYSIDYWRILIGPWLMSFVAIIYERWANLDSVLSSNKAYRTYILDQKDENLIPNDMSEFSSFQENDEWNHYIYSKLLKISFESNSLEIINIPDLEINANSMVSIRRNLWKRVLGRFSTFFNKNTDHFLYGSRLSFFDLLKVNLNLLQFPVFYTTEDLRKFNPDLNLRKWKITTSSVDSNFIKTLKDIIPFQIPKSYLEGFKVLKEISTDLGWPGKPKSIYTSTAFHDDDVFKQWTAEKCELGTPLFISQHGGNYGQAAFSFTEYHELKISNSFLSWGWSREKESINPIGSYKKQSTKNLLRESEELLFIISLYPRYSGSLLSMPISTQVLNYLEQQVLFCSNLKEHIKKDLVMRLYPYDYGWSVEDRILETFPNINIDKGERDFSTALNTARLVVSGWNTTTYLESLAMNKPTVIFWDPVYFELNDQAKEYFKRLERVGIFHKNVSSAINHIEEIWEDVDAWWQDGEVKAVKKDFVNNYVRNNEEFVNDLIASLKSSESIR